MEDPSKPMATTPDADGDGINPPDTKVISPAQEPGVKIPKENKEYDTWDLDAARNRQGHTRGVDAERDAGIALIQREAAGAGF